MGYICGDNRFEIIAKAKAKLLESTNIKTSEDEMKVLDNFLFRCWQMGWLDRYDDSISEEEFAEQWSKFDINKAYNKIMEERALKQYEVPTGSIKIWDLPEGYQFTDENGNVINATKIVLEKKEKEYPKTYEECCGIIGFCSNTLKWDNPFRINRDTHPYIKHLDNLMEIFCKLIICRDAYWKIAGEEMGLGKPWEPDYDSLKTKYTIVVVENKVVKLHTLSQNHILTFPTEEMRDAFYENFKELIEQCKELL